MRWIAATLALAALAAAAQAHAAPAGSAALFSGNPTLGAPGYERLRFDDGLQQVSGAEAVAYRPEGGAYVDSVRLMTAAFDGRPTLATALPDAEGRLAELQGRRSFGLSYIRNWPAALAVASGQVRLDLTPHAGFGVSSSGAQTAEAGAQVKLRKRALQIPGVPGLGEGSPFYLYAGASRRALGLGVLRSEGGPAKQDDGLVKTARLGVGVEHGLLHAAFGYSYEQTRLRSPSFGPRTDNRIGLTLSIR